MPLHSARLSVCVCTHNGEQRLPKLLRALAIQTLQSERWELLVIDNASNDNTAEVANSQIKKLLSGRGRMVQESRTGLSFARQRGTFEAQGEVIAFLDDDNVPSPFFVECVLGVFAARPMAGVIGGKVIPRWEVEPTPLAKAVAPFALAICDLGNAPKRICGAGAGIVGAGLCARTAVLRAVFQDLSFARQVTDRTGGNLISGGDLAISVRARQMGWECWYDPSLVIEHCLPAARMKKDYLLRLYEGIGRGQAATRKIYDWKARTPISCLIGAKDFARWVLGRVRGPSQALRRDQPDLAADLHDLQQALTLGRARQAISWPRS